MQRSSPQFYSPCIHASKTRCVIRTAAPSARGRGFSSLTVSFERLWTDWDSDRATFPRFFFFCSFLSLVHAVQFQAKESEGGSLLRCIDKKTGESLLIFPLVSGATRAHWLKTSVALLIVSPDFTQCTLCLVIFILSLEHLIGASPCGGSENKKNHNPFYIYCRKKKKKYQYTAGYHNLYYMCCLTVINEPGCHPMCHLSYN